MAAPSDLEFQLQVLFAEVELLGFRFVATLKHRLNVPLAALVVG